MVAPSPAAGIGGIVGASGTMAVVSCEAGLPVTAGSKGSEIVSVLKLQARSTWSRGTGAFVPVRTGRAASKN